MIPKYTQEEYLTAKSKDLLPLLCKHCNKIFYIQKHYITKIINNTSKTNTLNFCSKTCSGAFKNKSHILNCTLCNKEITVKNKDFKKSKSGNHFCSQSCAAIYNNAHKTKGTRRSKLEQYLEEKLKLTYPQLEILFNDKKAINSELDIYIPSLKLAFELNGIFHYEPIFGESKFNSIQQNDANKFQKCQEHGISLCIIDTSSQKYFKEQSSNKFFNIIKDIIDKILQ
uniref:Hydrolase n=1 Tax=Myoviridae sp. ctPuP5 TaxID=2823543 RepID=A0A8S5L9B4_9CAUD|nr:MAG TPA: hydrolase [Myoviridae sp. ctPuP5]